MAGFATGHDRSASVTITLTDDGAFASVGLTPAWRSHLGAAGLGPAVIAAVADAHAAAVRRWSDGHVVDGDSVDADSAAPSLRREDAPSSRTADADFDDRLADAGPHDFVPALLSLLDEVDARIDDIPGIVHEGLRREVRASGPRGTIRATGRHGDVATIEADQRWLAEADRDAIVEELGGVLRQVQTGPVRQTRDALRSVGPIGALYAALDEPAQLMRRLGLTAPARMD